jgi:hypothetical protein
VSYRATFLIYGLLHDTSVIYVATCPAAQHLDSIHGSEACHQEPLTDNTTSPISEQAASTALLSTQVSAMQSGTVHYQLYPLVRHQAAATHCQVMKQTHPCYIFAVYGKLANLPIGPSTIDFLLAAYQPRFVVMLLTKHAG